MKSFDVLCITLINLNLLAKPVDRSLFDRDATQAEEYSVVVGGDGTNQAVTLSQLGWRTGVCGSIGDDHFGQLALQMLSERGVDTSAVTCKPGQQTAVCFVMIGPDGERNFLVKRGACDAFHLGDIPPGLFLRTRVLNIGSLFTFRQLYGKPLAGLLRQAQEHGVLTSADAMYDTYQLGPKSMDDVLPFLDYFFPSYGEAKYLTGECDAERMADALLAHGVKTVVIKLGADGCLLKNAQCCLRQPAFPVPVVDTTGAGDSFIAGFLHGVCSGWDEARCIQMASAAAAINIGAIGATGAIRSAGQVLDWLRQRGYPLSGI